MPFHPGQRVVCIDDNFPYAVFEMFDAVPWRGGVFTVAEMSQGKDYRTGTFGPSVRLEEFPPLRPGIGAFLAHRFRPLDDQIQQQEQTTAQLTPA
jgi:hypothetical protein